MNGNASSLVERVAAAIPEKRAEVGVSIRELSRLSGVSRPTVTRLERGKPVDPALVVRVWMTLLALESVPAPKSEAVVLDFERKRALHDFERELDLWIADASGVITRAGAS